MSKIVLTLFVVLYIFIFIDSTGAQENTQPDSTQEELQAEHLARMSGIFLVEDPTSLYNFSIDDEEVEFFLDGSWKVQLDGKAVIYFGNIEPILSTAPPVFSQEVDLTSWIFINQTWYFESTFAEKFTKNTVAAGYIGKDESTIRHIRIGNSKIVFPSLYPFIQAGGGDVEAPGFMASFGGKSWRSDMIVRYDAALYQTLELSGMNEIHDSYTPVTQIHRGRSFILPDQNITGAVRVFVEDALGSSSDSNGKKWRELKNIEFRVFALEGSILLDSAASGNVAVMYNGPYASGENPGPSLISFTNDTRAWFLAQEKASLIPENFLPDHSQPDYEQKMKERFLIEIEGVQALILQNKAFFSPFQNLSVYEIEKGDLSVVHESTGTLSSYLVATEKDTLINITNTKTTMYSASNRDNPYRYPLVDIDPRIYLPSFLGSKIDTDIAIRSRKHTAVSQISLGKSVIPGTITIRRNGITDALFSFDPQSGIVRLLTPPSVGENIKIEWLEQNPSEKSAALTVALGGKKDFNGGLSLSLGSALRWNISQDGYTDETSSSPGNTLVSAGVKWQANQSFYMSSEAALDVNVHDTTGYYRILSMDGSFKTLFPEKKWYRQVPLDRTIELNTSTTLSFATRVPFLNPTFMGIRVIEDITISGQVLVMDTELSASDQWSAADILIGSEGNSDLRSISQLQISLKNAGNTEKYKLYVQLGAADPDLNENPSTTVMIPIDTLPSDNRWHTKTIPLTDTERALLSASQNIRIIITGVDSSEPSGRIILHSGPIKLSGTSYSVAQLAPPAMLQVGELTSGEPLVSLRGFSPQILKRFNPTGNDSLLHIEYAPSPTPSPTDPKATFSRFLAGIPLSNYSKLGFFIRLSAKPPDGKILLRASIPNPSSSEFHTILKATISTDTFLPNQWNYIELDLENNQILSNGSIISHELLYDKSKEKPSHIEFELQNWEDQGGIPYSIYIDELHLFQSNTKTQLLQKNEIQWVHAGDLLSIKKVPLVSDVLIRATSLSSKDISEKEIPFFGTLETETSLWKIKTKASVTTSSETKRFAEQTSHSIKVPLGIFSFSELFTTDFAHSNFTRENTVSISKFLPINLTTNMRYSFKTLYHTNSLTLMKAIILPQKLPSITIDSNILLAQTWKPDSLFREDEKFQDLWNKTAHYSLSQGEHSARERSVKAQGSVNMQGLIISMNSASLYKNELLSANRTKDHGFSLSAPVRFGFSTITPSWERKISSKIGGEIGGSWQTDGRYLISIPQSQKNLLFALPFYDLFRADIQDRLQNPDYQLMSHSTAYRLHAQRTSTGFLYDLWIPASITAFIKRNTEVTPKIENLRDHYETGVSTSFSALNSFGSFSPLQYFLWYEQDEIQQLYSWNMQRGNGYVLWDLNMIHTLILLIKEKNSLSLENSFTYTAPDISGRGEKIQDKVAIAWKRDGKSSFVSMLINSLVIPAFEGVSITTKRIDTLSVSIIHIQTPQLQKTVGIDYEHSLNTGIGKNGIISIFGGAGLLSYYPTEAQVLSLHLGISGTLTY